MQHDDLQHRSRFILRAMEWDDPKAKYPNIWVDGMPRLLLAIDRIAGRLRLGDLVATYHPTSQRHAERSDRFVGISRVSGLRHGEREGLAWVELETAFRFDPPLRLAPAPRRVFLCCDRDWPDPEVALFQGVYDAAVAAGWQPRPDERDAPTSARAPATAPASGVAATPAGDGAIGPPPAQGSASTDKDAAHAVAPPSGDGAVGPPPAQGSASTDKDAAHAAVPPSGDGAVGPPPAQGSASTDKDAAHVVATPAGDGAVGPPPAQGSASTDKDAAHVVAPPSGDGAVAPPPAQGSASTDKDAAHVAPPPTSAGAGAVGSPPEPGSASAAVGVAPVAARPAASGGSVAQPRGGGAEGREHAEDAERWFAGVDYSGDMRDPRSGTWLAVLGLVGERLKVVRLNATGRSGLEARLRDPDPLLTRAEAIGLDFPLAFPVPFAELLLGGPFPEEGWWALVRRMERLTRPQFLTQVQEFRESRGPLKRLADEHAEAESPLDRSGRDLSPMSFHGVRMIGEDRSRFAVRPFETAQGRLLLEVRPDPLVAALRRKGAGPSRGLAALEKLPVDAGKHERLLRDTGALAAVLAARCAATAVLRGETDKTADELAPGAGERVLREGWIYGLDKGWTHADTGGDAPA